MCFDESACNQLGELTRSGSEGLEHWDCKGRFVAFELEKVFLLAGSFHSIGSTPRNLYLCLGDNGIRGIIDPPYGFGSLKSRPDIEMSDHLFLYFEFETN